MAQLVRTEDKAHFFKPITLVDSMGSLKAEKKSNLSGSKPKEQGTWVRYTRVTKTSGQVPKVLSTEVRREALHTIDPCPHKRQNVSQDEVLYTILVAVADVQPRWTP